MNDKERIAALIAALTGVRGVAALETKSGAWQRAVAEIDRVLKEVMA